MNGHEHALCRTDGRTGGAGRGAGGMGAGIEGDGMTRELLVWTHIKTNGLLHFTLCLEFKAADLWVGAFWKHRKDFPMKRWTRTDVWLCVLPTLPIHLTLYLPMRKRVAA